MIRLERVRKEFSISGAQIVVALDDISLSVGRGEFITVVGSNGSGKSTLLNVIAGKIFPTSGKVVINGADVTRSTEWERARYISLVFQQPNVGTADYLTLSENLALAEQKRASSYRPFAKCVKREDLDRYSTALKVLGLGLENRLTDLMRNLSGGERQVICVMMAAMSDPLILLFDEHVAALDPRASRIVLAATQQLFEDQNPTTLMVTHNIEHALHFGNRLIMLHRGKILMDVAEDEKRRLKVEDVIKIFHQQYEGQTETPKSFLNV